MKLDPTSTGAMLVMQDLFDCLVAEDFFGALEPHLIDATQWHSRYPQATLTPDASQQRIWHWNYDAREQRGLAVAVRPGIAQAWEKVPGTPVWATQGDSVQSLTPEDFMALAVQGMAQDPAGQEEGVKLFLEVLGISVRQTGLSLAHRVQPQAALAQRGAAFFLAMEQWASLRDRPFHPLAKAKQGLDDAQYQAYQAEFGEPVTLKWVAVAKHSLAFGQSLASLASDQPADYLLTSAERAALHAELEQAGLADTHLALPVHPWQLQHRLPELLGDAFEQGVCRVLAFEQGRFHPTSSLRSLACGASASDQIKLPMAVYSLGASRYLPAVKMINADKSEALLRQGRERDVQLRESLHLCEEGRWWAYMPAGASLFDEAPRHLSALVRRYPSALLEGDYRLLPMAALATPLPGQEGHFFDHWMHVRGLPASPESVLKLFGELCERFFDVNLRMFRLGMLGEVHGQNAVLVWRDGQAEGLLLRDHDSLRLYVPWLERNGLLDPQYRIKKGHAQTLYHDRPEDLLFWLQTLGIQVNLRAIIETLAAVYRLPAVEGWRVLSQVLRARIEAIGFEDQARAMLVHELFEVPAWPQKLLLRPMIARGGGPGSMPFGKGQVVNPLRRLDLDR